MFEEALLSMNQVLFTGFKEFDAETRSVFIEHVMNRSNWAKLMKRKPEVFNGG
jgi:hypothetical protein